jgi:hypothetical protein
MEITQARVKELFDYHSNGTLTRKIKTSNRNKVGNIVGSNNGNGYLRLSIQSKNYYVHQIIFLWNYGYIPIELDHKNGIRNDNRIENLREATHAENGKNLSLRKYNVIGINNVSFDLSRNKWIARIVVNKKTKYLGRFKNLEDAIEARKNAEILFYKDWRRINEIRCTCG